MRIALLALPGSMKSSLAGISDMFWLANQIISQSPSHSRNREESDPCFSVSVITADGKSVSDAQGRPVESEGAFTGSTVFDMIISAGMRLDEEKFPLAKEAVKEAAAWIKNQYQQGTRIAGVCAGGFVLGEAGLLDGRTCTTTWWLFHTLKERYPLANPVWGKSLVEHENIMTSGGPLSWVDVVLKVIGQEAGPDIARQTADIAVADSQPLSQHIYAPQGFLNSVDPILMKAENLIRYDNPAITVEELAAKMNMTTRTLHRKIEGLLRESPKTFITRVRIETALVLLEKPDKNLAQVAHESGYSDETAFRRAFNNIMGMSPGRYREWIRHRRTHLP